MLSGGGDNHLFRDLGEWAKFERGDIIGKDGRYIAPVAVDTSKFECPTCARPWPEAPHVALFADDGFLWVEGRVIPIRWKIARDVLEVLLESFGRFVSRERLGELAFSDTPDCDVPDSASVTKALCHIRNQLEAADVRICLQNKHRHGYRITTQDIADDFDARDRAEHRKPRRRRRRH